MFGVCPVFVLSDGGAIQSNPSLASIIILYIIGSMGRAWAVQKVVPP